MANLEDSAKAAATKTLEAKALEAKDSEAKVLEKKKDSNVVALRNDSNHPLVFPRIVGYDLKQVARGAVIELDVKEFKARKDSLAALIEHERLVIV